MLTESVILIGMPGSGKSTIGRYIADKVGVGFTDTDDLIRGRSGKQLQEIISEDGLEAFKQFESEVLRTFVPEGAQVIATGGSAVLYDDAMTHLKSLGKVVFLDADLPLLTKRLWNAGSRGIAYDTSSGDGHVSLLDIYMQREPLYYKYSDIRVHIRGKTVADISDEIMGCISSDMH